MRWHLQSALVPDSTDDVLRIVAENRKITDLESFFHPPSPLDLSLAQVDLSDIAAEKIRARLQKAKESDEKVVIFGDYDADGISATAVMWEGLNAFGIVAMPFIPIREKHGYGLSMRSVTSLLEDVQPNVILTVDNGIVAHEAVEFLQQKGIDVIVTDHHQPETDADGSLQFPPAFAVFHTTALCGTTVAWMLVRELAKEAAEKSLDLCAIGTIADQVPLVEANRAFAVEGLDALRRTKRVGIQVLLEQAKIVQAELNTGSVNYSIAPRINAMGRLKHGMDALRLLCTTSIDRAWELAQTLQETNQDRQVLTEDMLQHALLQAETWKDERIIVVASETYHEGVIGLIAGRLTEKYYKPSVVIAIGELTAKGSARSIPSVNVTELLRAVRHQLLEVGGHAMAAGLSVSSTNIDAFSADLRHLAMAQITDEQLEPRVDLECTLPARLCSVETATAIQQFAPFGQGNREPLFQIQKAKVLAKDVIGREGTHLKLALELEDGKRVTALWWGKAKEIENVPMDDLVSVAAKLTVNVWKNRSSLNFEIVALQNSPRTN